jgi:hypothetical protein
MSSTIDQHFAPTASTVTPHDLLILGRVRKARRLIHGEMKAAFVAWFDTRPVELRMTSRFAFPCVSEMVHALIPDLERQVDLYMLIGRTLMPACEKTATDTTTTDHVKAVLIKTFCNTTMLPAGFAFEDVLELLGRKELARCLDCKEEGCKEHGEEMEEEEEGEEEEEEEEKCKVCDAPTRSDGRTCVVCDHVVCTDCSRDCTSVMCDTCADNEAWAEEVKAGSATAKA